MTFPNIRAGTHGTTALFPIGEKVAHADVDLSSRLGMVVEGERGTAYRLVRLDLAAGLAASACQKFLFEYNDHTTYDVDLCVAAGGTYPAGSVCGVAVETQVALSDNDYFWLQIDGRAKCIDNGSGVSAGNLLESDSAGKAVADAAEAAGASSLQKTFGVAVDDAAADADITFDFISRRR